MDVRIGVLHTGKEIEIELADEDADKLTKDVDKALADPAKVLWITDKRGRRVGIPSERVAYVEISPRDDRRVGFGAH